MLLGLIKAMRPHQWVKNLFVLAPLVFALELFNEAVAIRAGIAFWLFCFASSAVYLLNDIVDIESDRAHPVKCKRPIPSGRVPLNLARGAAVVLGLGAVTAGYFIAPLLAACIGSYLVLNLAYSFKVKQLPYLDVLSIAAGFELRVLGGAFAAGVPPSTYLLIVTLLLACFLGFGKRAHELAQGERATKQRGVLSKYNAKTLSGLLLLTAIATVCTYGAYTLDPKTRETFGSDYLAITTVFTLLGVLRFYHLVRNRPEAESPTEVMLRDWPFLLNLVAWGATVVTILYLS